jgi:hypothetical protein
MIWSRHPLRPRCCPTLKGLTSLRYRSLRISIALAWTTLGIGSAPRGWAQSGPAAPGTTPAYRLVVTSAKRLRGDLTVVFQAPRIEAQEWLVHAARLPELSGQVDLRSALPPRGRIGRELSELGRPILLATMPVDNLKRRHELEIRVSYEATLLGRKLVERKPGEALAPIAGLDARSRRLALTDASPFDFRSQPFQEWLADHKLRRSPNEDEIEFARRVFLELKKGSKFGANEKADWLASHLCSAPKTDAGGLAIVYVSALRAGGVPARVLAGRRAEPSGLEPLSKKPYDVIHCRAEFFAQGVGWIPADVADAVLRDKSPEGLRYFGQDEADFVTLHVDTDLVFDTYFGRKTVPWLQNPTFWVTGSGTFDGQKTSVDWKVQVEPIEVATALSRKPGGSTPAASKKAKDTASKP